jgi:hypothetical protein
LYLSAILAQTPAGIRPANSGVHKPPLIRDEGQQRDNTRPLNRFRQRPLVLRAGSGDTARQYFAALSYKTAQRVRIFVVNFEFLRTEFADFFLEKNLSAASSNPLFAVTSFNILPAVRPWMTIAAAYKSIFCHLIYPFVSLRMYFTKRVRTEYHP